MSFVETKIGEYTLLIEAKEEHTINANANGERDSVKTGMRFEDIGNRLIDNAKAIVSQIACEFGNELISVNPRPSEVEVEFEISISSETNMWILTAGGNSNIKVRMKWENKTTNPIG